MKKIISLLAILLFTSCSLDDTVEFRTETLPIVDVDIPQEFVLGQTYTIKVWYERPSTCHGFDGFYYDSYLNERTIAVKNVVVKRNDCQELTNQIVEASFDFYVTSNGSYIFKFWQGVDDNGDYIFYEVEVPVID